MRINILIGLCVIFLEVLLAACSSTPATTPIATSSQPQPPVPVPIIQSVPPIPAVLLTPVHRSAPGETVASEYDIEIEGNQGSWSTEPYPLAFNAGSRISVSLRAVDEDYTFTIDALGIDVDMPRGQTKTVEINLPDEPILLVAYSRHHDRNSFASEYISAGSPEFLDPETRQAKKAFGLYEAKHD